MGRSRADAARITAPGALAVALAVLPLLSSCAGGGGEQAQLTPPTPAPARPPKPDTKAEQEQEPGLTALPSSEQVIAAVPAGRPDPFAPLPVRPGAAGAAGTSGAAGSAPAVDLLFTGVIRSAGLSQALVQIGDQSGPVCVGRRGVCSESGLPVLLPADWSVTSIDVASGRLVVRQGGQRRVFSL